MSILKFLGRGCAFNVKDGNTSAFIKDNNHLLLIDCGETVYQNIMKLNLLDDIKIVDIAITHIHGDHVGSLSTLLFYLYFIKGISANIHYPDPDALYNYLSTHCPNTLTNPRQGCKYKIMDIDELETYTLTDKISIRFEKTNHVDYMKSYSIYIIYKQSHIFYSGDTSEINFLKYINILSEVYTDCCINDYENNPHLSITKLSKSITNYSDRNKIYLMHIDEELSKLDGEYVEGFTLVRVEK